MIVVMYLLKNYSSEVRGYAEISNKQHFVQNCTLHGKYSYYQQMLIDTPILSCTAWMVALNVMYNLC